MVPFILKLNMSQGMYEKRIHETRIHKGLAPYNPFFFFQTNVHLNFFYYVYCLILYDSSVEIVKIFAQNSFFNTLTLISS